MCINQGFVNFSKAPVSLIQRPGHTRHFQQPSIRLIKTINRRGCLQRKHFKFEDSFVDPAMSENHGSAQTAFFVFTKLPDCSISNCATRHENPENLFTFLLCLCTKKRAPIPPSFRQAPMPEATWPAPRHPASCRNPDQTITAHS